MTPGEGAVSTRATRVSRGRGFSRTAVIIAVILIAVAIVVLLLSSGGNSNHYKLVFETGGQLVKGNQVLIGGATVGSVDDVKLIDNGQARGRHLGRPSPPPGHLRDHPRDLALGDRQPLCLDPARSGQRTRAGERRDDHPGRHDRPGRHRPALQHAARPGAPGPPQHHPGLRHGLRRQGPRGQPDLQVPEPVAGRHGPPAPGARPRPGQPDELHRQRSRRGLRGGRAPGRPLGPHPERQ